ncbi:unnamed protein product [Symbiodinium sp. CCMP2456]|nr:unnamed protein product [Symbiodinium sp. CCMP2456]
MAPKKKANTGTPTIAPGLGRLPADTYDPNVQHFKMIEECLEAIRDHPVFGPNIDTLDPLPLVPAVAGDQAGFLAPLDNEALAAARDSGGEYVCGVNLLWANPLESVTPGVPIMAKALSDHVHRLMARGPKVVEDRLEFVYPQDIGARWRKCCPEELQHAVIMAIHERIVLGAEEDELLQWRRVVLSCPAAFIDLQTEEDIYFHATNKRVKAEQDYRLLTHKTTQMIFDVYNFKVRKELVCGTLTDEELAYLYKTRLLKVKRSDQEASKEDKDRTSPGTIKACVTVYEKMFTHEKLRDVVLKAEQDHLDESPFASVHKLNEIVGMCRQSVVKMQWLLLTTMHRFETMNLSAREFSARNLQGAGTKQYGLVFLRQREMKLYLLGPFMDGRNFVSSAKEKLREVFESRDSYVNLLRPLKDEDTEAVDCSWQATWPNSALKLLELIESACFAVEGQDDATVRLAMKNGKNAQELLHDYSPYKDAIADIDEELKKEMKKIQEAGAVDDGDAIVVPAAAAGSSGASGATAVSANSGTVEDTVEAKREAAARRLLKSYLVLESEEDKKSPSLLASSLSKHHLLKAAQQHGNCIVLFDVNGFGEAVALARHGTTSLTTLAPNEIYVVLNGGRTNNQFASKHFGVGPGVGRSKCKGSNIVWREILVTFTPDSVQNRKWRTSKRALAAMKCSQKMFWWFDASTDIPLKSHLHVPGNNGCDMMGPFVLEPWTSLPCMAYELKKTFWGKRRQAVGGKTVTGDSDDEGAEQDKSEIQEDSGITNEEDIPLPDVGGGRGTAKTLPPDCKQPVNYHEVPCLLWESVMHATSGSQIIDLTPQTGRLACWAVTNRLGYIGVTGTPAQKEYIEKEVFQAVIDAMSDPSSKLYAPSLADPGKKRKKTETSGGQTKVAKTVPKPKPEAQPKPAPKPGAEETAVLPIGDGNAEPKTGEMSAKLKAMLDAAKLKNNNTQE